MCENCKKRYRLDGNVLTDIRYCPEGVRISLEKFDRRLLQKILGSNAETLEIIFCPDEKEQTCFFIRKKKDAQPTTS